MENNRLYTLLALAGTTPFVACALLPLIGIDTLPVLGALDVLASTYGLAIICFLAGAHWGTYLLSQSATPFNLFISGNVVFLAVWFAFIGAEYILRWLFQKPSEIVAHLERGGLSLVDAVGVAANPFSRSLRITRSLAVNYMLFSARQAD